MSEDLTLDEVASALGVHYMTVYKYVRTGRLPARRMAGRWRVSALDVAAWRADQTQTRGHGADAVLPGPAHRRWTVELVDTLVSGSESAAWEICTSALASSHTPESLYLDVVAPAMRQIGEGWAGGSLTVAQEHRASAIMARLIGRLGPLFVQRGRPRGHVILGAPSGDTHALASAVLADLLRGRGIEVVDLGADTPVDSFLEALARAGKGLRSDRGVDPDGRGTATRGVRLGRRGIGASVGVVITSPISPHHVLDNMARIRAGAQGSVVLGGLQVAGLSAATRADLELMGVRLSVSYQQALALLTPGVAEPEAEAEAMTGRADAS